MVKAKLKRHESFPLKEGWIEKGLKAMKEVGYQAFNQENGVKTLGIGSNMVKSLKYWLVATNIIEDGIKPNLTEFGETLFANDAYMENNISWWLVHYFLTTNLNQSPVFYIIQNVINKKYIDKDVLKLQICDYFKEKEIEYNDKLVLEDINMFFRLYYNENFDFNPEENTSSPLSRLRLLEKGIGSNEFIKKSANISSLSYLVVYYCLENLYKDSFEIQEAYNDEKSPCKIFNLEKGIFDQYINQMKNANFITVNKTAGLNTIYINRKLSLKEIYDIQKGEGYAL